MMEEESCEHLDQAKQRRAPVTPSAAGCEDCLRFGGEWVHLRICLQCGHVGCCDDSPYKHATEHHDRTKHPVVRSYEPGEDWAYCFEDDVLEEEFPALGHEAATAHYAAF